MSWASAERKEMKLWSNRLTWAGFRLAALRLTARRRFIIYSSRCNDNFSPVRQEFVGKSEDLLLLLIHTLL